MYRGYIPVSFSQGLNVPVDHNAARLRLALPRRIREWEGECPHEPKERWCGEKDGSAWRTCATMSYGSIVSGTLHAVAWILGEES